MTNKFRKFMTGELIVAALVNAAMNVAMAYVMFSGHDVIPVRGASGVALDLLPSSFFPGLMMVMIVSSVLRFRSCKGGVPRLPGSALPRPLARLPRSDGLRALVIGVGITLAIGAPCAGLLYLTGLTAMSFEAVLGFKAIYGALLGLLLCPIVVLPVIAEGV